MCSDKDAGKREHKTPTPCASYRQREKENQRIRKRDKEKKREKEREGRRRDRGEKERRVARLQIFISQDSVPRSAHHGVRRGEARVHVEGRAGRSVWARDDARHRACKGKTE